MAAAAFLAYESTREVNPITGQTQHIGISQDQEIALGLQSAPQMAEQFGGADPDGSVQQDVSGVGERVVAGSAARDSGYRFHFEVLADRRTVNAFALPGGPVFITRALLDRLENEAQLAGVLGHEVGHVVGRHTSERIAKDQLTQGLLGAVAVATSDEEGRATSAAQVAAFVAQLAQLRYGREDETQADELGVRLMSEAGYDPRALIAVMRILASASGGGTQPEFLSTHPDPGNRAEHLQQVIAERYPNGVPGELTLGRPIVGAAAGDASAP